MIDLYSAATPNGHKFADGVRGMIETGQSRQA
jgi:hypothetical protein